MRSLPPRRSRRLVTAALTATALAAASPAGAATQEFPVPGGGSPQSIVTGPDGDLWFTVPLAHRVDRLTPAGVLTPFGVGYVANAKPEQIVVGPDRSLWSTDDFLLGDPARPSSGVIHRLTTQGQASDFPLPTAAGSQGLSTGTDGGLWYTQQTANLVGRLDPSGAVREFPLPAPARGPQRITTGADGALWFTEAATSTIGRLTVAGAYTQFTPPTRYRQEGSVSPGITLGPDGAIWFTEFSADRIGRIGPDGRITEFPLPAGESQPLDIISGPDGALWFTENFHGHVVRLTVAGQFTSYTLPGGGVSQLSIGPDAIWYTRGTDRVGRLDTLAPPVVGQSVDAAPVSGKVLVKQPGQRSFAALGQDGSVIPVGSELDTSAGRVRLTAAAGTGTPVTKTAEFFGGRFVLSQPKAADAVLDLKLSGPLDCTATKLGATKRRKPSTRYVWGDGKGTFRTTGKRSAATVRGTIWQVEDRCDATTVTRVRRGVVTVRDFAKGRTVTVKAGRAYRAGTPKRR